MLSVLCPVAIGWKATGLLVLDPGCTTAGMPVIVPVAVVPEVTVTLANNPPAST